VFNLKRELLAKLWKFSFANYVISIIGGLPSLLLPIIITNRADPSMSGFFYIDMMITNLLFTIPIATTQALFAEGSHNEDDIQTHLKKTILIIAALLFPSILVVYFSGSLILSLFGKEYAENGLQLLQLLAVSSLFSGIIYIGNTLLNIRQKINKMIMINAFSTLLILGVSSLLITKGLAGIGIAFLVSQAIVSVFHVVTIRNELRAYVKA
jgi:O-antigen/teichoic acid export membrane protein